MMTTYTIRKGNQYSRDGASLIGVQEDGRITVSRVDCNVPLMGGAVGDAVEGDDWYTIKASTAVMAAARATIADGQVRTLTIGEPTPACDGTGCANGCERCDPDAPAAPLCPLCHTVCYGDCTASQD